MKLMTIAILAAMAVGTPASVSALPDNTCVAGGSAKQFSPSVPFDSALARHFQSMQEAETKVGRSSAHPADVWSFRIIAGISKVTADYYGGFEAAKALVYAQIATVNSRFNDPHVFNGTLQFTVDSIYQFTGNPVNELFVPHPGFDYRVTYDGFPTQGGGWYGPPWNSIHHSWSVSSFGGTFGAYATDGIVHEFGHSRGALDLYAIRVNPAKNPINHTAYDPELSIMNYPYGVTTWDQHTISIVNQNGPVVFTNSDYIDEDFPASMHVLTRDSSGIMPIQGVTVTLYPVLWYTDSLRDFPSVSTSSGLTGDVNLSPNPFGPYTPSVPWNIAYPNFLIVSQKGTAMAYNWLPITAVQNAYFKRPDTSFLIIAKLPVGCCDGPTGNIDCDPANLTDISDLSRLIDFLYISFAPFCCKGEANIDGSLDGVIDIADLTALIDYLYIGFNPPVQCM